MAVLNITKYGGLALVEYTGQSDRLISVANPSLNINMPVALYNGNLRIFTGEGGAPADSILVGSPLHLRVFE